jgi:hypothetical protein
MSSVELLHRCYNFLQIETSVIQLAFAIEGRACRGYRCLSAFVRAMVVSRLRNCPAAGGVGSRSIRRNRRRRFTVRLIELHQGRDQRQPGI